MTRRLNRMNLYSMNDIKQYKSDQRETLKVLIQDEIIQITEDIVKLKGLYSSVLSSAEVEKGILRSLSWILQTAMVVQVYQGHTDRSKSPALLFRIN